MKQNPVYNREMRVSSRSLKLPLIIFLFNGILFLVNAFKYVFCDHAGKSNCEHPVQQFMDLYEFVTSMEVLLLMFMFRQ